MAGPPAHAVGPSRAGLGWRSGCALGLSGGLALVCLLGCASTSLAERQPNSASSASAADVARSPTPAASHGAGAGDSPVGSVTSVGKLGSGAQLGAPAGGGGEAPRDTSGRFIELDVVGFLPALVWVPWGIERRPLLVAAHGAGGRPEPHCERWQRLVGERAFILCVRGAKTNRSEPLSSSHHYYPDHLWLGRAVDASVAALVAREARVDARAAVYAGYSQGAVMGALMLMTRAERFPRALLIEGQQNDWSVAGAARWKRAGGQRVALACGLLRCAQAQELSRQSLARGGIDVALRYAAGAGHTYGGAVGDRVSELLEWLVADDPRWQEQ